MAFWLLRQWTLRRVKSRKSVTSNLDNAWTPISRVEFSCRVGCSGRSINRKPWRMRWRMLRISTSRTALWVLSQVTECKYGEKKGSPSAMKIGDNRCLRPWFGETGRIASRLCRYRGFCESARKSSKWCCFKSITYYWNFDFICLHK